MSATLTNLQLPSDMQDTAQRDELKAASVKFLGNVKARFGEHSSQVHDVHKTLDIFRNGALSKREAHKTILDTLEGNDDLRQELMDILMHTAADWAPGDFDLQTRYSTQPSLEPAPRFLQPAHEPQIRLPSLSSSWFPFSQVDQPTSLGMFNGYHGFNDHDVLASSPSLPIPPPFQLPNPPTHLWTDSRAEMTYADIDGNEPVLPPPVQTIFRNPWGSSNYAGAWTNDSTEFPLDGTNFGEHFEAHDRPSLSYNEDYQASLTYPQYAEPCTTQTAHQSLRTLHTMYDASPTNHDSFYATKSEEQHPAGIHALPTPSSQSPPSVQQTERAAKATDAEQPTTKDRNQSSGEPFKHILCGKGFATLSGVKKHHWGKKVNDLATTTGCWAKYKKPDVAWNDHPSCKEGPSASAVIRAVPPMSKQGEPKAPTLTLETLTVVDVPQVNTIPGFLTIEELPHTIVKTVNTDNATVSSPRETELVYHSHRLPSCSSLDSLLTAVNVVSRVDTPKPQGRTESIALHLNAQVAAAEQHGPFVRDEPSTSSFDPPHYRSIAPAALDTIGGTGVTEFPNDMSGHFVNYEGEEQSSVLPSDVGESHVAAASSRIFRPLAASSPGPARKKRKV